MLKGINGDVLYTDCTSWTTGVGQVNGIARTA